MSFLLSWCCLTPAAPGDRTWPSGYSSGGLPDEAHSRMLPRLPCALRSAIVAELANDLVLHPEGLLVSLLLLCSFMALFAGCRAHMTALVP